MITIAHLVAYILSVTTVILKDDTNVPVIDCNKIENIKECTRKGNK